MVDLVEFQLKQAGKDCARKLCRQLFDSQLDRDGYNSPAAGSLAPVAGVYTNLFFDDVSGFREGDAIVLNDVSASQSFCLEVVKITPTIVNGNSAAVAGAVDLANTVQGISTLSTHEDGDLPSITASDTFWLRGKFNITGNSGTSTAQSVMLNSFADIAGSGTLHGIPGTTVGWQGHTVSSFGAMSHEGLMAAQMRVKSKSDREATHIFMSPVATGAYAAAAASAGATAYGITSPGSGFRKELGASLDKYQFSGLACMGKPIVDDANCPATVMVLQNDEAVKLGVWDEFAPLEDGSGSSALISQSTLSLDFQIYGCYELLCTQRNAVAFISGVSSL